jgi:hypothetical protein
MDSGLLVLLFWIISRIIVSVYHNIFQTNLETSSLANSVNHTLSELNTVAERLAGLLSLFDKLTCWPFSVKVQVIG